MKEILENTAAKIGKELRNEPEVECELRITLSKAFGELGDDRQSEAMAKAAIDLCKRFETPQGITTAEALYCLSNAQSSQGRLAEAERAAREALEIQEKLLGTENDGVATTMNLLGEILYSRARYDLDGALLLQAKPKMDEARALTARALRIRQRLHGEQNLLVAESYLAMGHQDQGERAEINWIRALSIQTNLLGNEHPRVLQTLDLLVGNLYYAENYTQAEAILTRSLALRMKLLDKNHPDIARTMAELGSVREELGQKEAAESMYTNALRRITESKGKQNLTTQDIRMNFAYFLVRQGRAIEAEQLVNSVYTDDLLTSGRAVSFLRDRTDFYARQGRWQEAAADYRRLLEFEPKNHVYHHWLGSLLLMSGDTNGYRALCKRAAELFLDSKDTVTAERTAYLCLELPDSGVSLEKVRRMAEFAVKSPAAYSYMVPFQHLAVSLLYYREGRYAEALASGATAAEPPTCEHCKKWPPRKSCRVQAHLVRAMAYHQTGQPQLARAEMTKAADLQKELPALSDRDLTPCWIDVLKIKLLLDEATQVLSSPIPAQNKATEPPM